eukprot:scaffold13785_cov30-Tisochrysis_lutea.AAC.1
MASDGGLAIEGRWLGLRLSLTATGACGGVTGERMPTGAGGSARGDAITACSVGDEIVLPAVCATKDEGWSSIQWSS